MRELMLLRLHSERKRRVVAQYVVIECRDQRMALAIPELEIARHEPFGKKAIQQAQPMDHFER